MLTLLTLLMLILILLAIPVTVTFQLNWLRVLQGSVKLQWAFGLVSVRLPRFQSKVPAIEGEEVAEKIEHFEKSSRKNINSYVFVRQKYFRRRIIKFLTDFWHAFHKKDLSLRIRIGLGDPADTGQLWAIVGPIAGVLTNVKEASFKIEPEFFDTTFELDSSGSIRFYPLQIIYLSIAMFLSPSVWRGIKQMRNVV